MTEQTYEEWMNEGANKREAAAQASRLFNEAAIERILNNVGKQHWPPMLDREASDGSTGACGSTLSGLAYPR
jgi:hypothetical protein